MDYTKEDFKKEIDNLRELKRIKTIKGIGLFRLEIYEDFENLILFGVSRTFKEKCKTDIKKLEIELINLKADLTYAHMYENNWKNEQIFLEGKIKALNQALNYC